MLMHGERRSLRLKDYDYSHSGAYFVTVCTHEQARFFGDVVNGEMLSNEMGEVVEKEWLKTPTLRPYVELDAFCVMPNHFHGIILLANVGRGTARRAPLLERFGKPVSGSLPTIVRAFKSVVTRRINELRGTPGNRVWQRNYYEHIIRDDQSLSCIREYIATNPLRWHLDREHPNPTGEDEFDRWLSSFTTRPHP